MLLNTLAVSDRHCPSSAPWLGRYPLPPSLLLSVLPSLTPSLFVPVMSRKQGIEVGMSQAHVRSCKSCRGDRQDGAVRGNAVSANARVSGGIFVSSPLLYACLFLPCLITPHTHCMRLTSIARGFDITGLLACIHL